jgi:hypothetical protein
MGVFREFKFVSVNLIGARGFCGGLQSTAKARWYFLKRWYFQRFLLGRARMFYNKVNQGDNILWFYDGEEG